MANRQHSTISFKSRRNSKEDCKEDLFSVIQIICLQTLVARIGFSIKQGKAEKKASLMEELCQFVKYELFKP